MNDVIPFVECELVEFDICNDDKSYALSIKDKWGHTRFINIKEERNWLGRTDGVEFKDVFKAEYIRKYHHEGNTKKIIEANN